MQTVAFTNEKDDAPSVLLTKSMLDGNVNSSSGHSMDHGADFNPLAVQLCKIFKEYNLYITGTLDLPDGNRYDRIFNVGGGNCYFYAVCQGLNFFGISIDHVQLRTNVGQWLQNPDNARLMRTNLWILPSGLYHHLKRFPAPPSGWATYLSGMTWQDWGVHVQVLE